jgi:hypothetical protein
VPACFCLRRTPRRLSLMVGVAWRQGTGDLRDACGRWCDFTADNGPGPLETVKRPSRFPW